MNIRLAPYSEYKDSGLAWLGRIPKHWEVRRSKYLLREVNERSSHGQEQLLSVSQYTGVTPRRSRDGGGEPDTRAASLVGYKRVAQDDLVVNIMLAWNGSLGVARSAGIVSPAYCVYQFNDHAEPWYYHNLLRLPIYKGRIKVESTGVVESRLRLYSDDLFRIEALVPPKEEQVAIARFVETFTRKVDRLIRAKRRLIDLLNERKQAIIHRAVTRGLDPNVRLKPSGVEWLGDVPEYWKVGPLKRFVARRPGAIKAGPFGSQLTASEMVGSDVKVYTQRNVIDRDLDGGVNYVSYAKFEALRAFQVFPGDVLVTSRGTIGRTALVTENCQLGILHPCLLRVQPDVGQLIPEFLMTLIQDSQLLPQQLTFLSNATTIDVIYSDTLSNIIIPVPPKDEQHAIVSAVEARMDSINAAESRAKGEIDLLREYRTRLIADVVTGKLDVRGLEMPTLDAGESLDDLDTGEDARVEGMTDSDEVADGDEQ